MAEVPEEPDVEYVPELPREVLVKIFSGLAHPNPNSVRELCAAASVCPSWREAAKEPNLWRVLWVNTAPLNARLTGPRLQNLVARSCNTLTRLRLVGCPLVNDAALTLSLLQQPCLVYVSVPGCARITRPCLAYALCYREDFQGVVAQLNDPRQTAADAQRCCVALCTLLNSKNEVERAAALAEAQAAGTLDALLRCAALHAAHAGVQAASCYALARYVCIALGTEVTSYPPIFQAAVAALKAHPLDMEVQRAALLALQNACCFGLVGTPGVPALLDAIPLVLAALRAFPTDLAVQEFGCHSLAYMCGMDAFVAEAVAAAGALGLFIRALNLERAAAKPAGSGAFYGRHLFGVARGATHRRAQPTDITDDSTPVAAVDAIKAIALAPAALPQASAGIDAVMHALQRHEKNSEFAAAACKTLGIYLRCAATRHRARSGYADFGVKAAAAAHSSDAKVKKAAEDALQDP